MDFLFPNTCYLIARVCVCVCVMFENLECAWSGGQIISVVDIYLSVRHIKYLFSIFFPLLQFISHFFIESTHIIRIEHDDGVGWCCPRRRFYFFSATKAKKKNWHYCSYKHFLENYIQPVVIWLHRPCFLLVSCACVRALNLKCSKSNESCVCMFPRNAYDITLLEVK